MDIVRRIAIAVEELDEDKSLSLLRQAISQRVDPAVVLQEGIVQGLKLVGKRFENKEYYLAELILAGEIGKRAMEIIDPCLPKLAATKPTRVVIGTVKSDIHDIGKNLVAAQLRVSGYEVHDLGVDVPSINFIDRAENMGAEIIGMSAFLTTTTPAIVEVLNYLRDMGLRNRYKVIIGGGGTSPGYAKSVGADGWAPHAIEAVNLCNSLVRR